jgi:hypothetical protein
VEVVVDGDPVGGAVVRAPLHDPAGERVRA